tara:strand:+ start:1557 stop:1892 length:336 start_codon:yes stop_codon:yes gene_type:complete
VSLRKTKLNKEVTSIKREAKKLGYKIVVSKTEDQDSCILANEDTDKELAVLIGCVELNETDIITSFIINVRKWKWAEAEGFTRNEMVEKLGNEIFSSIDVKHIPAYLMGDE